MSKIIEIFKEITSIQRCSKNHNEFISFMKEKAKIFNYEIEIDIVNNIICRKKESNSKICLQSHYDIVCLVDNTIPEIIEENGYLKAKNSTLGADNGIGCAYMLALMEEQYDLEFLFTADEEIGLIGANEIELEIYSPYMLNLDSEEEGEICIGCAGGVDIFGYFEDKKTVENHKNYSLYEIDIGKLVGGHSGINIHENRPNALKLIAKIVKDCDGVLLDLNGGERINSIPSKAKAIIASNKEPKSELEKVNINKLNTKSSHFTIYNSNIIDFINNFENGVLEYNQELEVVESSINLAICKTNIDDFEIQLSARSMDNKKLEEIKNSTIASLEKHGFKTKSSGKYPAWKPDKNEFTKKVLESYKKHINKAELKAIHAGLECAIFKDKFPKLKIASIGPTISNPHSYDEKVNIKSVDTIFKVIKSIIET